MGTVLVVGGLIGSLIGAGLFELLTAWEQIDTVISILYVAMLGSVGTIMAREAWGALRLVKAGLPPPARKRRHPPSSEERRVGTECVRTCSIRWSTHQ